LPVPPGPGSKASYAPIEALDGISFADKNRPKPTSERVLHNFRNKEDYALTNDNSQALEY
jgi:hypothetical protein